MPNLTSSNFIARVAGLSSAIVLAGLMPQEVAALTGNGTQADPYIITSSNWNLSGGYYWEATSDTSISGSLQLTNTVTIPETNYLYVRTSGVTLTAGSVRVCYTDNCFAYAYISNGARFDTTTGSINVGFKGTALLDLDNAAATSGTTGLSIIAYNANSNGTVNVKNGSTFTTAGSLDLGYYATSSGTLNVNGSASSASVGTNLSVGENGTGAIDITGGGSFATGSTTYVGKNSGAAGTVLISGGSHWTSAGTTIGYGTSSTGGVTVTGSGSYLWDSGNIAVGSSGTGKLTVEDGALAVVAGSLSTGANGVIDLKEGLLAIKSAALLTPATVVSTYNIDVYTNGSYVDATAANLGTVYFSNLAAWQGSSYYATYSTLDLSGYTLTYGESAIPEPSTCALFGGITALGFALRKGRKK